MLLHSYAKINLGLHILRKRDDGYHDIQTIFHRVNIFDEITLTQKESGITIRTNRTDLPIDTNNLCVHAARKIFEAIGYDGGLHIDLKKNIPVGAGLGGGSSDAASILRHLPSMLDTTLSYETLYSIALSLGSDVPFFLNDSSAYATGRGEVLEHFELDVPYWIVLVYPQVFISTAWAYSQVVINPHLLRFNLKEFLLENIAQPTALVNRLRNDFEPIVFQHYEDVMRTKEMLYRTGAEFALVSGSGSSVYGFYSNEMSAYEAADFFSKKYQVFITPLHWKP